MWISVALEKKAIHYGSSPEYTFVDGDKAIKYYFDSDIAKALEDDGFLLEMWNKLDALFDWGDCDYFLPERCIKFKAWLIQRLKLPVNNQLKQVYEHMLELANIAIAHDTGISFDF